MNHKLWKIVLITFLVFLALSVVAVVAGEPNLRDEISLQAVRSGDAEGFSVAAQTQLTPTRFITVTSTSDEGGKNERCEQGHTCTLRRAINEVRYNQYDEETYRIAFDIDTNDPGYDATNEVWVIEVDSDNSGSEVFAFREFGTHGHVLVDGTTQPIGRSLANGPRIILSGDNNKGAFTLTGGDNIVRGLAFQGFGDRMISVPGTSNNLIEDNWFGLTITGEEIYLRNPEHPEDGSGEIGIYVQSGGSNNTVQENVLAGFDQTAITVDGVQSYVLNNTVGTRADGTVPEVRWERKCHPSARYYNWFAGAGVQIYGDNHLVENNRIVAMLYYSDDPLSTSEDALSITGDDHVVRYNILGVDADGQPFGVCGDGIHVGGSGGGHDIQVMTNTVVGAHGTAGIFVTGGEFGYDLNGITVQHNVIEDSTHDAFAFGDKLPATLRLFNPAQVITISGTTVTGASGLDSPCAGCTVELFLDEIDTVTETLESLGTVTADGSGNWFAELPRTLDINEGIRTASTTAVDGQITHPSGDYSAGMTTKISDLYVQSGAPEPTEPPAPTVDPPLPIPEVDYSAPPTRPTAYNTIIVVTNAGDPDDSRSTTCSDVAADQCTLRRALVEADELMDADPDPDVRPIHIQFNIPTSDAQYDGTTGAWIIELYDTSQLNALPTLGSTDISKSGRVVIDGWSQPDHDALRADKPRIVVRGADSQKGGLVVNGEHNVIRGLAFQRFKDILKLNHGYNTVEDCWFGLTTDGQEIYIRNTTYPDYGSGDAAITLAANADNNLFQDNVFLGLTGAAINIEGSNDNYVLRNYVGTRADGTIDVASVDPANICDPTAADDNWFGGTGINLRGDRNQAISNTIVGLLVQGGALQTPPDAIVISSEQYQDNLIQHNVIGRDAEGTDIWTCGRGMDLKARYAYVFSNTIVGTGMEGIYLPSGLIRNNANMMRGNIISDTALAIEFGDLVPEELRFFEPARVITFSDSYVAGDDGDNCPYCWVDVYRDDGDTDVEALVYLGSDAADENGDWRLDLAAPIVEGQGLRTISTIRNYGVIQYFEAGTSSKLSGLYRPPVVRTFSPGIGGTIVFTDPYNLLANVQVPGDALGETTTFTYTHVPEPTQSQGDLAFAGRAFNLDASAELGSGGGMTVTLEYDPDDLLEAAIADVKDLRLLYWTGSEWDDVANTCTPASGYDYDTMARTVTVRVCHLSSFSLFSSETGFDIYLPLVVRNLD